MIIPKVTASMFYEWASSWYGVEITKHEEGTKFYKMGEFARFVLNGHLILIRDMTPKPGENLEVWGSDAKMMEEMEQTFLQILIQVAREKENEKSDNGKRI